MTIFAEVTNLKIILVMKKLLLSLSLFASFVLCNGQQVEQLFFNDVYWSTNYDDNKKYVPLCFEYNPSADNFNFVIYVDNSAKWSLSLNKNSYSCLTKLYNYKEVFPDLYSNDGFMYTLNRYKLNRNKNAFDAGFVFFWGNKCVVMEYFSWEDEQRKNIYIFEVSESDINKIKSLFEKAISSNLFRSSPYVE